MTPFLDLRDLAFAYGERPALHGVTLTVAPQRMIALLGPNGSGKTTLFRLLAGLLRPAAGEARLLGLNLTHQADAARRQLGVVFQSPSLDDKLTVRENLTHHGHLHALHGPPLAARITELLARFRLTERRDDRVGTLSGGLQRRVELARCLLHRPTAILLDEPTNGLDPTARLEFWALLRQVRREDGVSLLFTTHWFEEAEQADEVAILHRGCLVAHGPPAELSAALGAEVVVILASDRAQVAALLRDRFGIAAQECHDSLRFPLRPDGPAPGQLLEALHHHVTSVTIAKPTLGDVYVARTDTAWGEDQEAAP
jgi:ABC-2 type transport system ATP-binding protein